MSSPPKGGAPRRPSPRSQKRFLLGVDIGSTVVKAVLFGYRGQVISQSIRSVAVMRPKPEWVERDAGTTWDSAAAVIRTVTREHAGQVAAIGVTGCGNGAVFLDGNGQPVRAGILSSDTRAAQFVAGSSDALGQTPYPGQLSALLSWYRATESSQMVRSLTCAVFWKDWVRFRLTDELCSDFTDMGAAGLLKFPMLQLRTEDQALPPMRRSLDQAGCITSDSARRTGLPPGTPVYTGCIDCEAAAIGSGVRDPGEVSVVAGTWSINQAFIKRVPRVGGHFLVNPSAEPGRWLVLEGSPSSAANFDWALRTFGGKAADITEAVRKTRHSQLIFMPQVPSGKGAFVGLSSVHTRHDLYRAVMEGVVHAHRRHLERLARSAGPISRVTLGGGAARNTVWCRLFADGLGIQVDVPRVEETGALGAAMCAGVGCGLFPSLREAQLAMSSPKRTFLPDPKRHEETSGDYERYLSLCESIQP